MSRMNVVDSPPGTTSPSSPSSSAGLRTSTTSAPRRPNIAACSRKSPCTARTPTLTLGNSRDGMPSFRRLLERRRRLRVQAAFAETHGPCVLTGPFRGMRFPADALRTGNVNMASRLLGSYEAELHEIVERVVAAGFDRIIDVGTGSGYYAVGLARRLPASTVEAYDPDPAARALCRALAEANSVLDRVHVRGGATASDLRTPRAGRTFVKMDCEGCELELLRPDVSELLRSSTILVELHDFLLD